MVLCYLERTFAGHAGNFAVTLCYRIVVRTVAISIPYADVCVGVELQTKALSVYIARSLGLYPDYYIPSCECCSYCYISCWLLLKCSSVHFAHSATTVVIFMSITVGIMCIAECLCILTVCVTVCSIFCLLPKLTFEVLMHLFPQFGYMSCMFFFGSLHGSKN